RSAASNHWIFLRFTQPKRWIYDAPLNITGRFGRARRKTPRPSTATSGSSAVAGEKSWRGVRGDTSRKRLRRAQRAPSLTLPARVVPCRDTVGLPAEESQDMPPGGWYTHRETVPLSNQRGTATMSEVTEIMSAVAQGDPQAASQLLPLVYDELRQLAAHRLAHQRPGQPPPPPPVAREASPPLAGDPGGHDGDSRGHFSAAAAEAMRRILVENARRKGRRKRGGDLTRCNLDAVAEQVAVPETREDLLALDEALTRLAAVDPQAAQLVQLRYFAGLSIPDRAQTLGVSPRTADRLWAFA